MDRFKNFGETEQKALSYKHLDMQDLEPILEEVLKKVEEQENGRWPRKGEFARKVEEMGEVEEKLERLLTE